MIKLDIRNLRLPDFVHRFNKTRQTLSDVILQEGDGVAVIPTLAKKITSELAEVIILYLLITLSNIFTYCLLPYSFLYSLRVSIAFNIWPNLFIK